MPSMCETTGDKLFQRLPTNVVPRHYNLTLKPDLEKNTFSGILSVDLTIKSPTSKILFNVCDIKLNSIKYLNSKGEVFKSNQVNISAEDELATIDFGKQLQPDNGKLEMEYVGNLNDKLKGFYRTKYVDENGKVHLCAATKFEPVHARRALPCWDEPALKAKFDVTMVVPNGKIALSNMQQISEKPDSNPNYKVVKFATSPIMSTYLLAFVVGDYDYVEGLSKHNVKVRAYTPVGKKDQGKFALDVAVKSLDFFTDYFHIPYPLPKLDIIALADFLSGAMENWGLVTFRESCMLIDPVNSSTPRKQIVAIITAHEISHQWFGNLVTMEWFTHLWLNEGFASFMECMAVDHISPQYNVWAQCATDTYLPALEMDALRNSHPIEIPVGHPSEIESIFDHISYRKGASIIRMLHNYIGNDAFRNGLTLYLNRHSYKNAVTEDLWAALTEVSGKPVGKMMSTWTKQMGYPILTVSSRQDGNNQILSIAQEKFSADGVLSEADKSALWLAPISVITKEHPEPETKYLLDSRETEIVLMNTKQSSWIKLNPGAIDFYRVKYSPQLLALFPPAIRSKSLSPIDRLNIVSDMIALAKAGKMPTTEVLKILDAFKDEDNYAVWTLLSYCLGELNSLLGLTNCGDLFKRFGRKLLANIYAKVGWEKKEKEDHLTTLLRVVILQRMASLEDPQVIEEAKKRFVSQCSGSSNILADIRLAIYRTACANSDEKGFENFFKLHQKADSHEEKNRLLNALGASKDPKRIKKVLEYAISDNVRSQDAHVAIISVAMTRFGREAAWKFFQDKYDLFVERYGCGFVFRAIAAACTENFTSEEKAAEIENFFAKKSLGGAERTIQQSLESVRLRSAWLSRDLASIKSFLSSTTL